VVNLCISVFTRSLDAGNKNDCGNNIFLKETQELLALNDVSKIIKLC